MKHLCDQLTSYLGDDKHLKITVNYDKEAEGWFLIYESFADAKEVLMGEAEEEGELSTSVEMKITYCPFCGKNL